MKKLTRDTESSVLAGVCAGIASYLGVEAILIRIVFVLFALTVGSGILLYIALWVIIPPAKSVVTKGRRQVENLESYTPNRQSSIIIGVVLIILGAGLLILNILPIEIKLDWGSLWIGLLILAIGIRVITSRN